jgi:CBS domain-containing protein
MKLDSLCRGPVLTIDRAASLQQAAQRMREKHVGALVITEDGAEGRLAVGIVTDRDLTIEGLARGLDGAHATVGDLGVRGLVSAPHEAGLAEAVALMQDAGVRRLLVRDGDGRLIGLVSFDDLLQASVTPLAGLAEVLRKGLEREAAAFEPLAAPVEPPVRVPAMGTAGWAMR